MALSVDLKNSRVDQKFKKFSGALKRIRKLEMPPFVADKPDLAGIKALAARYSRKPNILVIANGGSRTSSYGFYKALVEYRGSRKAYFLTTMEPDHIHDLKQVCKPKDTLVMPISKSGNTVGVLEAMFAFKDYNLLPITSAHGALYEMIKHRGGDFGEHPEVGGRYSGRTVCGLLPAALLGVDIARINAGAVSMYRKCGPKVGISNNPALKLACTLFDLDKRGYTEVFVPVYSERLVGFLPLIIQIMHESVCKAKKGQTFFGDVAPECHHHTNQRFFGGRKNVVGLFVTLRNQDDQQSRVNVPKSAKEIPLREGTIGDIDGVAFHEGLKFEYEGTMRDAVNRKIPNITVSIDKINPYSVGEFMAFWQYVAVYSSVLRRVNPYDQPQVESSKEISFELRRRKR